MSAQAVRAFMSIGEVLALLQVEFPDVTVSKIRFLEGEGLIEPQRSPSGYRKFTYNDVERLRYILRAQRDQYLPLRVIKDQLDEQAARPHAVSAGAPPVRLSREELIEAAGIDEETLTEMESFGLVAAVARRYDGEALEIARSVGALARFGLRARHLRAVRAVVERETGLIEQAVAPLLRRKAPGAIAEADETAREISGLLQELHNALLRGSVRGVLGR
ncbi:transcriptional regulator FtsR [Microbispora bryophytorum]|uniref:MerR family transcriptional regulator n=1 Tax=Microbispora bryophytorum TaxID=1460882 RepID=A0A8H9LFZ1_9ACTN|nr:MerR family transcriptional regulator [Microbispora bryophytorum]MBD3139119.1 MerR family transcriptional regulator [Microbispora bryophytorum]TQS03183.1 MerR family transcriptional regulator [Microbispora bryophytorum]GGO09188.1 MerR family transcriptional regulator [Microbispora bryophytorum]